MAAGNDYIAQLLEVMRAEVQGANESQAAAWSYLRDVVVALSDALDRHTAKLNAGWDRSSNEAADAFMSSTDKLVQPLATAAQTAALDNSFAMRTIDEQAKTTLETVQQHYNQSVVINQQWDAYAAQQTPNDTTEISLMKRDGANVSGAHQAVESYKTTVSQIPFTAPPAYTPPLGLGPGDPLVHASPAATGGGGGGARTIPGGHGTLSAGSGPDGGGPVLSGALPASSGPPPITAPPVGGGGGGLPSSPGLPPVGIPPIAPPVCGGTPPIQKPPTSVPGGIRAPSTGAPPVVGDKPIVGGTRPPNLGAPPVIGEEPPIGGGRPPSPTSPPVIGGRPGGLRPPGTPGPMPISEEPPPGGMRGGTPPVIGGGGPRTGSGPVGRPVSGPRTGLPDAEGGTRGGIRGGGAGGLGGGPAGGGAGGRGAGSGTTGRPVGGRGAPGTGRMGSDGTVGMTGGGRGGRRRGAADRDDVPAGHLDDELWTVPDGAPGVVEPSGDTAVPDPGPAIGR